jgi:hypothetical protein
MTNAEGLGPDGIGSPQEGLSESFSRRRLFIGFSVSTSLSEELSQSRVLVGGASIIAARPSAEVRTTPPRADGVRSTRGE